MQDRCSQTVLSLLFGCLTCLMVTSDVNADGRVFVLDLRNSSGLQGFRDAERACASQHARLASAQELHHAVVECFFSSCTRGWLYGGTVGTTVCDVVGSVLKAVDVRTENATDDAAHLDAFCIKDKGVPCGDPPAFPNARLQEHSGYEMGDELLYTCVPGYVMPSGHSAFSLLCDSCGEWYGLVEICVKDETESHVDYEDKFTDSYGEAEHHTERPEEAQGEVYEEVHGTTYPEGKMSLEQQEMSFGIGKEEEHQDQHGEPDVRGEVISIKYEGAVEGGEKDEERAVEDFVGHPSWEQERTKAVTTEAATEAPVSLLSQKHLFWFPSEAFQEEGHPASTNPVTQRASGAQSEESKEHESQERHNHQLHPVDVDDHDHGQESFDDHDDQDDHDDSNHDDLDAHEDSHHDDQDHDSRQDEDDHDDRVKHYIPAQREDVNRHDNHDDHYDMGEHEEDRDRIRHSSQEYDDRDDTYDEHESYEEHEDITDDHTDDDRKHPDGSEEHPDHDDHDEEHYDPEEDDKDRYHDHDDHEHDDQNSYDDHDSHEDLDDQRVIFSIATDDHQNITQETKTATTDETWLDGYPVVPEATENADSTGQRVRPEDGEKGTVRTTDKPNEVEMRKPGPYTSSPEVPESPTTEPVLEQEGEEEVWPGLLPSAAPSPDRSQPSDSPPYSDTLDYDTQQPAPTHSWLGDLTEHPFLDHHPAPPMHDGDVLTGVMEEHTIHTLPGETGERGDMEGEMGETICTGENCPPHPPSSSSQGPTVAAIIVVVCALATAIIIGVWCYRRQQQKSSVYEMNGKGQSQTRQGQQIEMQQKV